MKKPENKSYKSMYMTSMSGTGKYFKEIIPGSTEPAYDDYSSNKQTAGTKIFTGFRMDGDDTLMSPEERLRIISRERRSSAATAGNTI